MKKAVLHIGNGMGSGGIEANGRAGKGELNLISITLCIFCSIYNRNEGITAADSSKAILNLLPLEFQLLFIGHVPEPTPSAVYIMLAIGG